MKRWLGAVLLGTLLIGCGQDTATSSSEIVLTAVLPAPATPGQALTLYGRLPAAASSVLLSADGTSRPLPATVIKDGLTFTLPDDLTAGVYDLSLPDAAPHLTLDVLPRLDRVVISGQTLSLTGAGWGQDPGAALIEVNGQRLVASGDTHTLVTAINAAQGRPGETSSELYGALNVRVLVGERASASQTVRKAAVSVTGDVRLPLAGTMLTAQTLPPLKTAAPSTDLLISADAVPPQDGLVSTRPLAALHLIQVRYATLAQAQQAYNAVKSQQLRVEYDAPIHEQDSARLGMTLMQIRALDTASRQWQWPLLGMPQAWTRTKGAGVTVAVVDTGVTLNHPDLKANLLPGRDFVDGDRVPQDVSGHGTHVSGLIAANGAVMGAAPLAHLLPVRVIGPDGGSVADLVRGLLWAANLDPQDPNPHPAQVINLSLGTPEYSAALEEAVSRVLDAGILVVAATGNDGGLPYAPANIPGVIAVTAVAGPVTTYQPSYANKGPGTRISAYGGDLNADQDKNGERDGILSTDLDANNQPGYALRQGTSMAAPQVSGVAALLLSAGAPPQTVKALLEGQASDLNVPGMDLNTGWGLVSALSSQSDPDLYVVALDVGGQVITYVRPTAGVFDLHSLPPGEAVNVLAASDRNHNGIVGEAGELISAPVNVITPAGQVGHAQLQLEPSSGEHALKLPR